MPLDEDTKAALHMLKDALQLTLLFHRGGAWSSEDQARWKAICGSDEATSRALCEHIREVLARTADTW